MENETHKDNMNPPRQSGGPLFNTISPYRHVAVFPPRLMYPLGQLSFRVVPCTTGSAGSVPLLLNVESSVVQSGTEMTRMSDSFHCIIVTLFDKMDQRKLFLSKSGEILDYGM